MTGRIYDPTELSRNSSFATVLPRLNKMYYLDQVKQGIFGFSITVYSRTPLIRPPSESHWCGRIRGMVAREGFIYEQKRLSITRYVVV